MHSTENNLSFTVPELNLQISDFQVPSILTKGEWFDVSWIATNFGDSVSSDYYFFFYLSNDEYLDDGDLKLQDYSAVFSDNYPKLFSFPEPGLSHSVTNKIWTSTNNRDKLQEFEGNIYLLVETNKDYYSGVFDEVTTIPLPAIPIEIQNSDVDLVISDATAPTSAALGTYIDVTWTVKNQGTTQASSDSDEENIYEIGWTDGLYLSEDEYWDEQDIQITKIRQSYRGGLGYVSNRKYRVTLDGGDDDIVNSTVYLSSDLPTGNWNLLFVTDNYNNQLEETNENNNSFALPIEIIDSSVDLVPTEFNAPTSANFGDSVNLSWSVVNQGQDEALGLFYADRFGEESGWSDSIYLSKDEKFDSSDILLGVNYFNLWQTIYDEFTEEFTSPYDGHLESGNSYTINLYPEISLNFEGIDFHGTNVEDFYLLLVTNDGKVQSEADYSNNTLAAPLQITITNADLVVSDVSVPSQIILGDLVNLSWTVTNQGTQNIDDTGSLHNSSNYGDFDHINNKSIFANWLDYVYISQDEFLDETDVILWNLLANTESAPLNSGSSYTNTIEERLSLDENQLNQIGAGDRYLIFAADGSKSQPETDGTNNTLAVPVEFIDNGLHTPIYRFQNQELPGTYLFVAEEERSQINSNYANFYEEGLAFKVAIEPKNDLVPMYRFQSKIVPGTYLYAGAEERTNIHQNYSDSFIEEGLSFYVYGVGEDKGATFYRFRNDNYNLGSTYLFATGVEAENIRHNFPDFIEEGAAFEAVI